MKSPRKFHAQGSAQTHMIGWVLALSSVVVPVTLSECSESPKRSASVELCVVRDGGLLEDGHEIQGPGIGVLPLVNGRVNVPRRWDGQKVRISKKGEAKLVYSFVFESGGESSVEITIPAKRSATKVPKKEDLQ